jgi:tetratricopeptide (TPR) repeat protein
MPDFGPFEAIWLIVACGVHRLAQLTSGERVSACVALADSLEAIRTDESSRETSPSPEQDAVVRQLASLQDALRAMSTGGSPDPLLASARSFASDVESAGALLLARSILASALRLSVEAGPREHGLTFAQLGRIARTLGDFSGAEDHYSSAGALGRRFEIPELEAREYIGRAVIALRKGNYPRGRELFRKALACAEPANLTELSQAAHNGLQIAAAKAGDFDSALEHGWKAFVGGQNGPDRGAELLASLAEICLLAGYPQAALHGFLASLSRMTLPRMRLPTLGSAVVAAARSEPSLVETIARAIETEAHAAFPYETGQALVGLASAYALTGNESLLRDCLTRARKIARQGGFFELMYSVEQIEVGTTVKPPQPKKLSELSTGVVRSIEDLTWDSAALELSTATGE